MTCTKCHGAGKLYRQDCGAHGLTVPCPVCGGDCAGANPPVLFCPVKETASARIKGDKDRAAQSSAPTDLDYDHTQDGTANFERALLHASYHEVESERLVKALERANAQAEQFERDYYLKCDEHERDMKDAATFMGKRDAHIGLLTELAYQYLSDLRYPPSPDSKERRIERINAALKAMEEQTDGE